MRVALAALMFLVLAASGCTDAEGPGPGTTETEGPGVEGPASDEPTPFRFVTGPREVLQESITVTVGPEDACAPAACPLTSATGAEPAFIKTIDISASLPVGMHAYLEVQATYDRDPSDAVDAIGNWNLQWGSRDLWVSGSEQDDKAGNATLSGFVTNHGPDPAELILVVLEPDGGIQEVEVTVHVRATPLDDAVHRTHVVGVPLAGGAVPITVELTGDGILDVRGPDDAPILIEQIQNGSVVTLPDDSPPGEYRLVTFGTDSITRFLVPAANRTGDLMRLLDTTLEDGPAHPIPNNGVLAWDVVTQRPPYMFQVRFNGFDGRSMFIQAHLTVTAPGGEVLIDDDIRCQVCLYSVMSWGSLSTEAMVAGTYHVSLEVEEALGWTVNESVGLYGQ